MYPIEIDGGKTDTRFVKEIIHTLGLEQKLSLIHISIAAVKAIIAGTKALISALIAGGWIAVVIILIVVLLGCCLLYTSLERKPSVGFVS